MTETNFKIFLVNRASQLAAIFAILAAVVTLLLNGVADPFVILPLLTALSLPVSSISGIKDPLALVVLLIKIFKHLIP